MSKLRAGQAVAKQAPLDALCGIYVLLNFLALHVQLKMRVYQDRDENDRQYTTYGESSERKIFRELIHSADDAGHLCADTLTYGFAPARLKDTYERFRERNRLRGSFEEASTSDLFEFAEAHFDAARRGERRGIGVLTTDQSHWVLIAGVSNGRLIVFDSAGPDKAYYLSRRMNGARGPERQLDPETLLLLSLFPGRTL